MIWGIVDNSGARSRQGRGEPPLLNVVGGVGGESEELAVGERGEGEEREGRWR